MNKRVYLTSQFIDYYLGKSGWELSQEVKWRTCRNNAHCCVPHGLVSLLSHTVQLSLPRMPLLVVGWVLPYQLLIRKHTQNCLLMEVTSQLKCPLPRWPHFVSSLQKLTSTAGNEEIQEIKQCDWISWCAQDWNIIIKHQRFYVCPFGSSCLVSCVSELVICPKFQVKHWEIIVAY